MHATWKLGPDLAFNGVNGSTGEPLFRESAEDLARRASGASWEPGYLGELRRWNELIREDHLDIGFGFDPRRLEESGWGVVFAHGVDSAVREALAPLLELRREQAARVEERYFRQLVYRPGESKPRFLARHGAGPGAADPHNLPYYLLLVGGPEEIPFRFQYQLDVQYAVGRICFERVDDYARYAESVATAEAGEVEPRRRALFLAVANPDDRATRRCRDQLVRPLERQLRGWVGGDGWTVEKTLGEETTKAALTDILGGECTPGLLFTASHGMGFDPGDRRQRGHQGALLCRDWPGPRQWRERIPEEHYFSATDVPASASLAGLIAFHFACFGAGTPELDGFEAHRSGQRRRRAECGFVARLPQRLLSHPRGGALAVVGHVDRAWSYAFDWPLAGVQVQVFENALRRLLSDYPVGAAMEYFGQRYAELSADLSHELEEIEYGASPDFLSLSGMWTANNDARSYVVLGDPAVRLPGASPSGSADLA